MERDKMIAIGLVVGFAFLFTALLGVVAITGFLVFFTGENAGTSENTLTQQQALADADQNILDADSNAEETIVPEPEVPAEETPPAPVCGNNKKETGEQCENDSQCSSTKKCNSSCQCEDKPVERALVAGIGVEKLTFFCAPDFGGQRGLAVKIMKFKNTGDSNFSYSGNVTIKAVTGETTDSVTTNDAFKFAVSTGKTIDIYQKDLKRTSAPYLFLGSRAAPTKITVEFGNTKYFEYNYTLKGNDFGEAGCL